MKAIGCISQNVKLFYIPVINFILQCVYTIFTGMPPGKETVWSKYLRTLKRRRRLNLTLGQKVSFITIFFSFDTTVFVCVWFLLTCCPAGIFGGFLLGVRSNSGLAFYDWETAELIRRIEIQPKHVGRTVTALTFPTSCVLPLFFLKIISCLSVFRSSGLTLGSSCLSPQMSLSLCCATSRREWQQPWSPRKLSQKMG